MHLNREELITQLTRHGHESFQLESMDSDALKALFEQETIDLIRQFPLWLQDPNEANPLSSSFEAPPTLKEFWHLIKEHASDSGALYEVLERMVRLYDYSDIIDLLSNHTSDHIYRQLERMVRLKCREYQEWLLGEIERHYSDLPPEELFMQMCEYTSQRENIAKLKEVLTSLRNPAQQERIIRLAQIKNDLLKKHRSEEMEQFYKEFYENSEEKREVIAEILKLTNAYTSEKLKKMRVDDLHEMRTILIESQEEERREKKKIKHFLKLFEESIYQDDEDAFDALCRHALTELNGEQMQKIVDFMEVSNTLFAQRLKNLLKEFSRR